MRENALNSCVRISHYKKSRLYFLKDVLPMSDISWTYFAVKQYLVEVL